MAGKALRFLGRQLVGGAVGFICGTLVARVFGMATPWLAPVLQMPNGFKWVSIAMTALTFLLSFAASMALAMLLVRRKAAVPA